MRGIRDLTVLVDDPAIHYRHFDRRSKRIPFEGGPTATADNVLVFDDAWPIKVDEHQVRPIPFANVAAISDVKQTGWGMAGLFHDLGK